MSRPVVLLGLVVAAALSAGCVDEGASTRNFELTPKEIGWFAGDEAVFELRIVPTTFRDEPTFKLDRNFALEEILFNEEGASFGGDFSTREPADLGLRLMRDGEEVSEAVLDVENPTVDIHLRVPAELRDSSYVLELALFEVGWIKSTPFRVDVRAS